MVAALPEALDGLLLRLYPPEALASFILGGRSGAAVHDAVDWSAPSFAEAAADALARHGLVEDALYARLLAERPDHCDAIASVYEATRGKRLGLGGVPLRLTERHPAMAEDLLAGLRQCAGHGYATGWGELSTTTVFQVYRWRQPWVLASLPDGALREVEADYTGQVGELFHTTVLSDCVRRSLSGLCTHAPAGVQVTFHDLFFDLARFGTGRCVQRLRDHGVGQEALRGYSARLGLGRLSRHGPIAG